MNPEHPVYVISKGRAESRMTSKALEECGIPYHIVVEPQERGDYTKYIDPKKVLTLPFSNLGQGSIPARNWVWDHAVERGAEFHWILDDNIRSFWRWNYNLKVPVADGTIFKAAEDFVGRYENVGQAGFQYYMFVPRKRRMPPFYLNGRIYSCILQRNDVPHRWRGKYNEDTDLSLRILKDGYNTILFNAFLAYKMPTLTMKGGNTDELYEGDGRLEMAQSLVDQHPDVVRLTKRFGRYQHLVDYRPFRANVLVRKDGVEVKQGTDDYGMVFEMKDEDTGEWHERHPAEPMRRWFPEEFKEDA